MKIIVIIENVGPFCSCGSKQYQQTNLKQHQKILITEINLSSSVSLCLKHLSIKLRVTPASNPYILVMEQRFCTLSIWIMFFFLVVFLLRLRCLQFMMLEFCPSVFICSCHVCLFAIQKSPLKRREKGCFSLIWASQIVNNIDFKLFWVVLF